MHNVVAVDKGHSLSNALQDKKDHGKVGLICSFCMKHASNEAVCNRGITHLLQMLGRKVKGN